MKKSKTVRAVSYTLAAALSLSAASFLLSACKTKADNESTPLSIASDLFDGVFNPFFYTSGVDGDVVGQTQIGMLSSDENGQLVAGEDEPCVVDEFSIVTTGTSADKGPIPGASDEYEDYYTTYSFAIKNDLVFSDGEPLTIDDVLFNIYMYLDPAYTGSSTMYSVNIRGLAAYRTQRPGETDEDDFNEDMDRIAEERISALNNWALGYNNTTTYPASAINTPGTTMTSDVDRVEELFMDELNTDWTTAMNTELTDYERYHFTENWEIFLYNYGLITVEALRNQEGEIYDYRANYDQVPNNIAKDQETLVQYVFDIMIGDGREEALQSYRTNLYNVINNYATSSTFRAYLVAEATRAQVGEDGLTVPNISGITVLRDQTSIPTDSEGRGGDLDETMDVLQIVINGEDPKAIQNFAFTVAPLHYYSPIAEQFSIDNNNFGVSWSDNEFMDQVRALQVPLGAGPYRATRDGGSSPSEVTDQTLPKSQFYSNNIVYFERNENFLLDPPKIKYLRYQVISQSLLYESVNSGTVHYGSPTATSETMGRLNGQDSDTLDYVLTDTLGYGYIGINASFVDDIYIRKAIMSAFNPELIYDYYGGTQLASVLYRPMSSTLVDYYPREATAYYPFNIEDPENQEQVNYQKQLILAYVHASPVGWEDTNKDGVLDDGGRNSLSFTFTVAGDTTDHPAYQTMTYARDLLNDIGFDVEVVTDSTALSKLASGQLEVWAAAWSTSSDPDMYQVYHKDSTATSILNWGFPTIDRSIDPNLSRERLLLDELALRIEEGRETTDVAARRGFYSESRRTPAQLYSVAEDENGDLEVVENFENFDSAISDLCALDLVMELAVEFPLYQRRTLYVFQRDLFDEKTLALFDESTAFQSPLSEIWEIGYAQ